MIIRQVFVCFSFMPHTFHDYPMDIDLHVINIDIDMSWMFFEIVLCHAYMYDTYLCVTFGTGSV